MLLSFTTDVRSGGSSSSTKLSIASFNLLAPLYIRPIDQRTGLVQPFASFDWIISDEDSKRILGNEVRLPKLLQKLLDCKCDFICVQELQLERERVEEDVSACIGRVSRRQQFVLPRWIAPLIERSVSDNDDKYDMILPPQSELEKIAERNRRVLLTDAAITNAIFYKSNKWQPAGTNNVVGNTTTCVTSIFLPTPIISDDSVDVDSVCVDPIAITSIHLDARSEEKRVQQLRTCLENSISCTVTPYIPACIIAGDYNCELLDGSAIHAFLSPTISISGMPPLADDDHDEKHRIQSENRIRECASALRLSSGILPTKNQLKTWDELVDYVTKFINCNDLELRRIDTGCTRAAYDHDNENESSTAALDDDNSKNNHQTMAQWQLDHIMYTPSTLLPLKRWATLEDDEYSRTVGLPNDHIPTDHLPIAAMFELIPHPQLCTELMNKLTGSIQHIESRHELELKRTNEDINARRAELENTITIQSAVQSTKKKHKNDPPPQEIIQHIQSSRAVVKEIKMMHRVERDSFVAKLTKLERMVFRHFLGNRTLGKDLTIDQWIENGNSKK
jgi:hypothetical protein